MVKPSSPTAAFVKASVQGSRTGVQLPNKGSIPTLENGMEDPESYWDSAKTPNEKQETESSEKAKQRLKEKNAEKPVAQKPRYSLPGQQTGEESEDNAGEKVEHILQRVRGDRSPTDMSRVSTAPPTPNSVATQREESPEEETSLSPPEGVRASPDEEQEEVVVPQARVSSPTAGTMPAASDAPDEDFPVNDDDDVPSPPPPETEDIDLSMREEEVPPTQEEVEFPADMDDDDDDDDDDDKEGAGYAVVHDPETPESVRAERLKEEQERKKKAKRKKNKKKDTSTVASRSSKSTKASKPAAAKATKQRKSKKKVTFPESPMGYPAGNREYEVIPVSNFKESPEEDGVRRSRRARVKPLAFWKNERPQYEAHHEEGALGEAMGLMPVVTGYISAQPTPYKKRKAPSAGPSKGGSKQKKAKKGSSSSAEEEVDEIPFDSRKLRKKYKIVDGEEANMWDESADDAVDHKVVSYADKMVATDLPLPATRKKSEGKVVGKASQAFNVPTDDNNVGYIMGSLFLPPGGIKDPESSGPCSLSFTVCQGQPKAVEVAFGDPNDDEGELSPKTAQRFLLGPGDMFRVMPGNCYRLENHSKTMDCLLSWTIIRPRRNASDS